LSTVDLRRILQISLSTAFRRLQGGREVKIDDAALLAIARGAKAGFATLKARSTN